MRNTFFPICSAVLFICHALVLQGQAQVLSAGSLDLSFSQDGKAIATLPGYSSQAFASDVQPDGSVIVAGQAWAGGTTYRMVVSRFEPDGDVDTTFGTAGFFTYGPLANQPYAARAVKVLSDGKILVAGDYGSSFVVLRLLANGTLDGTFTATTVTPGTNALLTGMAVQADGKIVICGQALRSGGFGDTDAVLYRVLSGGNVDSATFATSGRYTFGGSSEQTARCVAVQPDGKILYAGTSGGIASSFYVGRLTAAGVADNTFGSSSRAVFSLSNTSILESAESIALDASLNVVTLVANTGDVNDATLVRLTPTGILDTFFSEDGYLSTQLGGTGGQVADVQVQADGRILISGHQPHGSVLSKFQIRRFEWNGDVDSSFGTAGLVSHTVGITGAEVAAMAVQADRKIIVAGTAADNGLFKGLAAVRLHPGAALSLPSITITQHPQAQKVNAGQSATFTVAAQSDSPPVYSWYRGATLLSRGASPTFTLPSVSISQEGDYTVEVRVGSVFQTSNVAVLTVSQPPVLNPAPAQVTGFANSTLPLQVYVTGGRFPMSVRWFKGDGLISEYSIFNSYNSYLTLQIYNLKASDEGLYRVEVSNSDGKAVSQNIQVTLVTDPSVSNTSNTVVALGTSFALAPTLNSSLEYRVQWNRNGKAVPGAKAEAYSVDSASLADAATYTLKISSLRGSSVSAPMEVGVVDTRAVQHTAANGKKFQIVIPAAGKGMSFEWYKDTVPLEPKPGLSGLDKSTLSFDTIQPEDAGSYNCLIRSGTTELMTAVQSVEIVSEVPAFDPFTLPAGRIGIVYRTPLTLPPRASHFEVKGLPPGILYSKVDHTLTGTPSKPGDYNVSFTAVNPIGRSPTFKAVLGILPLAADFKGRFSGVLSEAEIKGDVDLTITPTGAYTGKMRLGEQLRGKTSTVSFKGVLATDTGASGGTEEPNQYSSTITFNLNGFETQREKPTVTLLVNPGYIEVRGFIQRTSDELGDYDQDFGGFAHRCPWTAKNPVEASRCGIFNVGFNATGSDSSPKGHCYTRATVNAAGTMSVVGKMSDDTSVTLSMPINWNYEAAGMTFLYSNRGYAAFYLGVNPGTSGPGFLDAFMGGGLQWSKDADSFQGQKNNPISFNTSRSVEYGSKYLRPNLDSLTGPWMMNATSGNVQLDFLGYGLALQLKTNHTLTFPTPLDVNPAGLKTLSFNAATGLFTGSGVKLDFVELYDKDGNAYYKTERNPYKVQGLVVRGDATSLSSSAVGFGNITEYFDPNGNGEIIKLKTSYPINIYGR